jgi:hypothetical protein
MGAHSITPLAIGATKPAPDPSLIVYKVLTSPLCLPYLRRPKVSTISSGAAITLRMPTLSQN